METHNKILRFTKKVGHLEPVLDKNQVPIPYFFKSTRTGFIFYRRSLTKLNIPSIFVTTGESTLGAARTAAEVILQRHKNKHLGIDDSGVYGRVATRTFREVAEELLAEETPKRRPRTQIKHRSCIPMLVELFGSTDINQISVKDFNQEIAILQKKGDRETFFDFSKHMNLVMRYAYNQKYASHLIYFPNPDKGRKTAGRRYTPDEIKALYAQASPTMKLQLLLSYENAMRVREVLYTEWSWVNLKTGEIRLPKHIIKTNKDRNFIVSPAALEMLRARFKEGERFVFPSPTVKGACCDHNRAAWRNLKGAAGIKGKARWHDLRHTALTVMLLEKRLDPLQVSEFAGVSVVTIQKIYLKPEAKHTVDVGKAVRIGE